MLLILVGAGSTGERGAQGRLPLPNRLLATRPLVELGAMAYSLYLWHWPLLIFWLSYTGHKHATFLEGAVLLVVSGVLAYLTNRLVEDPCATGPPRSRHPVRPRRPPGGWPASGGRRWCWDRRSCCWA